VANPIFLNGLKRMPGGITKTGTPTLDITDIELLPIKNLPVPVVPLVPIIIPNGTNVSESFAISSLTSPNLLSVNIFSFLSVMVSIFCFSSVNLSSLIFLISSSEIVTRGTSEKLIGS